MDRTIWNLRQVVGLVLHRRAALCVTLVCWVAPWVAAQQTDEAVVREWIVTEWKAAAGAHLPSDVAFEFAEQLQEVPAPAQLAAMRAAVAGHPDHPEGGDLRIYERRIKNGPDQTQYTVWYHGPALWRISRSILYDADGTTYWDTARDGNTVWGLSNDQLTLVDAENESDVRRHYAERGEQSMHDAWVSLVYGNFAFGWFRDSTPTITRIDGNMWVARAVNSAGVIGEWTGRWDPELGRGFVMGLAFRGKENGEPTSDSTWSFDGWQFDQVLGVWIAASMQRDFNGRHKRRLSFKGAGTATEAAIQDIAAVPDVAGKDSIRGAVTVSRLNDLRPSGDEVQWIDDARDVVHTEAAGTPGSPGATILRWIGWGTLAALAAALLWVRSARQGR